MPAQEQPKFSPLQPSAPARDGRSGSAEQPARALAATAASSMRDESDSSRIQANHLAELRNLPFPELLELARREGVLEPTLRRERDLLMSLLKLRVERDSLNFSAGVLEVLPEGFGFLRSASCSFLPGPGDIYVSPSQIRRFNLKPGHIVHGGVRPPKENERFSALLRLEAINYLPPEDNRGHRPFDAMTPMYPERRLRLETSPDAITGRVLDLLTPVGMGQRGLVVSPPRAGKTTILKEISHAVLANHPEIHVMILLIDERPEEVTDIEQILDAEVLSSTFDEPASRHVQVAEMAIERAKRLVESGTDVVILLDSLTRLARAYNTESPPSGRLLSGGVDASALQKPKQFFGSARSLQPAGSLTILATALVETGSRMDEVIFEEFKGTGNLEIVLDQRLANRRIYPALNAHRSGTRREELLLPPEDLQRIQALRRVLYDINPDEAMELLIDRVRRTASNEEFLLKMTV